jgi:hypothetical protein
VEINPLLRYHPAMVRWVLVLSVVAMTLVTSGCGRLSFDPFELEGLDAADSDAATATPDAPPAAVAQCTPRDEFTNPLTSNFDAGLAAGINFYQVSPAQVLFEFGVAKIVPAQSATPAYAGFNSSVQNFYGRRIFVEVVKVLNTNTNGEGMLMVKRNGEPGTYVEFVETAGTLYANSWNLGTLTTLGMRAYNPMLHRWWQIRERSGILHFETSPDGLNWTRFTASESTTPTWWNTAQFELAGGTFVSEANVLGEVHFDNFFDCVVATSLL